MSDNRIIMQRREVKMVKTGQVWLEVCMFETDGMNGLDSMGLETLPDDDMALLEMVITEELKLSASEPICNLLNYMWEQHQGIEIDGTEYEWDAIKHLFENIWDVSEE